MWAGVFICFRQEEMCEAGWRIEDRLVLISSGLWNTGAPLFVWRLALERSGQVDHGPESESPAEEVPGMWALDWLVCI